ncbi:MAG: tetratricopeptide repeat protein [Gemmatimonadota bacterium]
MPHPVLSACALAALVLALACRGGPPPAVTDEAPQTDDPGADRAMLEGRWRESVDAHRRLLERQDPDEGLTLYHLGFSVGSLGDHAAEARLYDRAAAAGYRSPDLLYNLGLARLALGELDAAEEALRDALAAEPEEAEFHYAAAQVALARGDEQAAQARLERATALDPGHTEAWAALAELYERRGDPRAESARTRAR